MKSLQITKFIVVSQNHEIHIYMLTVKENFKISHRKCRKLLTNDDDNDVKIADIFGFKKIYSKKLSKHFVFETNRIKSVS